jgi:hypothetical protein
MNRDNTELKTIVTILCVSIIVMLIDDQIQSNKINDLQYKQKIIMSKLHIQL